jgi:hypothetical protein
MKIIMVNHADYELYNKVFRYQYLRTKWFKRKKMTMSILIFTDFVHNEKRLI